MRIGLHRDPQHYSYSPWVVDMRRRMWSYLMTLDFYAFEMEGVNSGLELVSEVQRPSNSDNIQWKADRFAKPGTGPIDRNGYSGEAYLIINLEISKSFRALIRKRTSLSEESSRATIARAEDFLKRKYLDHLDEAVPLQSVCVSQIQIGIQSLQFYAGIVLLKNSSESDAGLRKR